MAMFQYNKKCFNCSINIQNLKHEADIKYIINYSLNNIYFYIKHKDSL